MPNQPTLSDVHVDGPLTDLSVRFTQDSNQFIADKVFPQVNVANKSDVFFTYDRSYWFKSDAQMRGPGTESAGSGFEISTDSYNALVYAIHYDLSDQVKSNADGPLSLERDAVDFVTQHLMQKRESDWVNKFMQTTSGWTVSKVGVASGETGTQFRQWNDFANSDPITDLRAQILAMAKLTGKRPNTLVLGPEVWNNGLVDHPDFLDRVKYGQTSGGPARVAPDTLAAILEIDRVLIPHGIVNGANEADTASYSFLHGKSALLCYAPPRAGLNTPSAGYTFNWSGFMGTGSNGVRIKRFRMEHLESERIEGEMAYAQKQISADLGTFYSAVVA